MGKVVEGRLCLLWAGGGFCPSVVTVADAVLSLLLWWNPCASRCLARCLMVRGFRRFFICPSCLASPVIAATLTLTPKTPAAFKRRTKQMNTRPTQASFVQETAAAVAAADAETAATLAAERAADSAARTARLQGLAHRTFRTDYVRSKVSLTANEWQRLALLGDQLVTGMKPGQRASRSLVIATMIERLYPAISWMMLDRNQLNGLRQSEMIERSLSASRPCL